MNQVALIGNLTKDPELKYTPDGKAVVNLRIALNEGFGDKKRTSFLEVVAFGKTAENCNQYILKGNKIAIEGRLQQDRWETNEGSKRSRIKIIANRIDFLTPKEKEEKFGSDGKVINIDEEI